MIDTPHLTSNLPIKSLKYFSLTASVSPSKPAATGINKNKFSQPSGATVGSVTEGTEA
jgi:hypothetical protein